MSMARNGVHMEDSEREGLAQFHKTISEQLNARLAESPRFFGVLVITGTAYGYVLWKFQAVGLRLFVLASVLALMAVFWALWYLAALGYAFRYLQNSQHRIEDDLGWDSYRNESTGIPPTPSWRPSYVFWLLPGIYHAHAFGLAVLLLIITAGFFSRWPNNARLAITLGGATGLASISLVLLVNRYYVGKFTRNRIPGRREGRRNS